MSTEAHLIFAEKEKSACSPALPGNRRFFDLPSDFSRKTRYAMDNRKHKMRQAAGRTTAPRPCAE